LTAARDVIALARFRSEAFCFAFLRRRMAAGHWQKLGMGPASAPGKVSIAMAGSLDAVAGRHDAPPAQPLAVLLMAVGRCPKP